MKTYDELLDLSEFDGQSMVAKYIHHGGDVNHYATTWDYVAFTYSLAFDELARKAYQPGHRISNLSIPLFFLARHSIELALKGTILEYADDAKPEGHDLVVLWKQLSAHMEDWGCPATDDWVSSSPGKSLTFKKSTREATGFAIQLILKASGSN
jgi:hypothetical protein